MEQIIKHKILKLKPQRGHTHNKFMGTHTGLSVFGPSCSIAAAVV